MEDFSELLQAEHIKIKHFLGRGGFAAVYSGTYGRPGEPREAVAVKVLQPAPETNDASEEEYTRMFLREAACTKQQEHKNIIRCFGVCRIPPTHPGVHGLRKTAWAMVLELAEPYTTKTLIVQTMTENRRAYNNLQAYEWLTQIASALAHLHGKQPPVIHRDIKQENILLKRPDAPGGAGGGRGRLAAKLADLGLHVVLKDDRSVMLRRKSLCGQNRSVHSRPISQQTSGLTAGAASETPFYAVMMGTFPVASDLGMTIAGDGNGNGNGDASAGGITCISEPIGAIEYPRGGGRSSRSGSNSDGDDEEEGRRIDVGYDAGLAVYDIHGTLMADSAAGSTGASPSHVKHAKLGVLLPPPGMRSRRAMDANAAAAKESSGAGGAAAGPRMSVVLADSSASNSGSFASAAGGSATDRGGLYRVSRAPSKRAMPHPGSERDALAGEAGAAASAASSRPGTRTERTFSDPPPPTTNTDAASMPARPHTSPPPASIRVSFPPGAIPMAPSVTQGGAPGAGDAFDSSSRPQSRPPLEPSTLVWAASMASTSRGAEAQMLVCGEEEDGQEEDTMLGSTTLLPPPLAPPRVSHSGGAAVGGLAARRVTAAPAAAAAAPVATAAPRSSNSNRQLPSVGSDLLTVESLQVMGLSEPATPPAGAAAASSSNPVSIPPSSRSRKSFSATGYSTHASQPPPGVPNPILEDFLLIGGLSAADEPPLGGNGTSATGGHGLVTLSSDGGLRVGVQRVRYDSSSSRPARTSGLSATPHGQRASRPGSANVPPRSGLSPFGCASAELPWNRSQRHGQALSTFYPDGQGSHPHRDRRPSYATSAPNMQGLPPLSLELKESIGAIIMRNPALVQPVGMDSSVTSGLRRVKSLLSQFQQTELRQLRQSSVEWVFGLTGRAGSCMYMAPEVFRKLPYNEKADVFSFAVLMYELLSRDMLLISYFNTSKGTKLGVYEPEDYAEKVCEGFRPPRPACLPDRVWALIEACWHDDPVQRPAMSEVGERLKLLRDEEEAKPSDPGGMPACVAGCILQ